MATIPLQIRNTEEDLRYGYCRCGCGEQTSIPKYGDVSKGWTKGVPLAYCNGHFTRIGKRYEIDTATGCWNWLIGLNPNGYASVRCNNRTRVIYKWLWEILNGPTPTGLELDHKCRNRRCINPEHLRLVTHAENMRAGAMTKLKHAQVIEIRRLLAEGVTHRAIAPLFNVEKTAITNISRGHTWRDIG